MVQVVAGLEGATSARLLRRQALAAALIANLQPRHQLVFHAIEARSGSQRILPLWRLAKHEQVAQRRDQLHPPDAAPTSSPSPYTLRSRATTIALTHQVLRFPRLHRRIVQRLGQRRRRQLAKPNGSTPPARRFQSRCADRVIDVALFIGAKAQDLAVVGDGVDILNRLAGSSIEVSSRNASWNGAACTAAPLPDKTAMPQPSRARIAGNPASPRARHSSPHRARSMPALVVVIRRSGQDRRRAIDLLQHHHASQSMRQRQPRQRPQIVGARPAASL